MRMMLIIISSLTGLSSIANAQASLTASVTRNPVAVDQQFQLNFSLNASGSNFSPPDLSDFTVLSGPNQSTSMQFINGNMTQSLTLSYILQPKREGSFKIGSAVVFVNGQKVMSTPISVTVTKNSTSGTGQSGGKNQNTDEKSNISSKNIYIKVEASKKSLYQGEALVATYKLYSTVPLINYGINKVPSLNGFWSHDIELPSQLQLTNEVYNGVNFQVGVIKKVVLFPQQSGVLVLDPMEGECIARVQVRRNNSNSPFDVFNDPFFNDPFFGMGGVRNVKFAVKSEPLQIQVKGLPSGPPSSFSGAVGKFEIEGIADLTSIKANDPVTFRLKIKGQGNLKLIDAPVFDLSPDIEKYDPKITDNVVINSNGALGTRTFEYLLIPRHQGSYEIPPIEFAYFDLNQKRYVTLKTNKIVLKVEKGAAGSASISSGSGKSDFQLLNREIRFIKTQNVDFKDASGSFVASIYFWILTLIPLLLLPVVFYVRYHQSKVDSDISGYKSKRANSLAKKKLRSAKKMMQVGTEKEFFAEITKVIYGFIGDKLKIPVSDLSRELAVMRLTSSGVSQETINKLMDTLDYCEMSSYARGIENRSVTDIYSSVESTITSIENEIHN